MSDVILACALVGGYIMLPFMNHAGTLLTVNLDAVAANYRFLRDRTGRRAAGVVKADAYGLGLEPVARTLQAQGCTDFFVVTIEEGVRLRAVTPHNIYLLGGIHSGEKTDIEKHNLIPVLNALPDIAAWSGPCAIHFDTGMNRLGLSADETSRVIDDPSLLKHLDVRVALSHFVAADEPGHALNKVQCQLFADIHARLKDHLPKTIWSLSNSSGIFESPADVYDMIRPGYGLYGGNPVPGSPNPMQPTITLDAVILQVRNVKKGETVGYGAAHTFGEDTQTATVCLGYADGFTRFYSHKGIVYWQGQPCRIVGRVAMDLFAVDIGHLPQKPAPGDKFEIVGPHQDIDTLAAQAGSIGYEFLTSLGTRYARRYIEAI